MNKKETSAPTTSAPSLQVTKIKIDQKERVTIEADERIIVSPNGSDGEASQERINKHRIVSEFAPDPDFMKKFQATKRFAIQLAEFNHKDIPLVNQMTIGEIRIAGEMEKENSRVEFVLMKWIKRTGKGTPIKTGQAVMYGEKGKMDIPQTVEMTAAIDAVIHEVWEYINGKNGAGTKIQLAFAFKKSA